MDLLRNGLLLMVIGMGTVFAFLSIMVFCIQLSARLTARFAHLLPEAEKKKPRARKKADAAAAPKEDDGVLLAILSGAIQKYRQEH